ncbi:unnamed protein product, partial [Symbiodinium necroappetens]
MLGMPVLLHVYDCGQALTQVGIGGAYHASVEVNGLEWDVGGYNRNVWSSSTCFVKGTGLAEDGCKRELITRLVLATAPDLRPLIRWASLQVFGPSELQRKKVEAVVSDPVEEVTSNAPGCKGDWSQKIPVFPQTHSIVPFAVAFLPFAFSFSFWGDAPVVASKVRRRLQLPWLVRARACWSDGAGESLAHDFGVLAGRRSATRHCLVVFGLE